MPVSLNKEGKMPWAMPGEAQKAKNLCQIFQSLILVSRSFLDLICALIVIWSQVFFAY
jgi:hypothetical protein